MKKIFAAVFSMALVLSLAGCGSSQPSDSGASQQVEGLTDEASVARARELMDSLMTAEGDDNVTEVIQIKTSTDVDGDTYDNTVTTTSMKDLTGDVPRFYIKTETQPAADGDAAYYIEGKEGAVEIQGDVVALTYDDEYIDSLLNPEDTSNEYRTYYDCASEIYYYEEDGVETVQLRVDPAKLMETGVLSEVFSNISSCVAEYTFNANGKLTSFINTVNGDIIGTDGNDVEGTIETKCIFTNFGTTEVPAVPEETEAAAETEQAEAESGE